MYIQCTILAGTLAHRLLYIYNHCIVLFCIHIGTCMHLLFTTLLFICQKRGWIDGLDIYANIHTGLFSGGNSNLSLVLFPCSLLLFRCLMPGFLSYPSLFDFSLSFKQSALVWKGRENRLSSQSLVFFLSFSS